MENRELDKWLATHVMGWHEDVFLQDIKYWYKDTERERPVEGWEHWAPATSISDAFQVVEKIKKDWLFSIRKAFLKALQDQTRQKISTDEIVMVAWPDVFFYITPLTICLAAKKAIEGES